MQLYYWSYYNYDSTGHFAVFADSLEEAYNHVHTRMMDNWVLGEHQDYHSEDYLKYRQDHIKADFNELLHDPEWELKVFDIKPGALDI